jgi:hypothetical protein
MKSALFTLLLSFTLFLTFSSCKKSNPVGPPDNNEIWPLKTGNTWVLQSTYYDSTGAVSSTGLWAIEVTKDTVVEGQTWYRLFDNSYFYTNKSDGLWLLWSNSTAMSELLLWKYPVSAGDNWPNYPYQVTAESTNVSITVPNGTYTCYLYRMTYNSQPAEDDYLCPGVGIVARNVYLTTSTGIVYKEYHGELSSLTLK